MSIRHFQYASTPQKKIEDAMRWLQNTLNLRDWTVELYYGDFPPDWVVARGDEDRSACVQFHPVYFIAEVWVSPANCKRENRHPLQSLTHEFLHIVADMAFPEDSNDYNDHPAVCRLENPITKLMFIEKKWKLPPLRPIP